MTGGAQAEAAGGLAAAGGDAAGASDARLGGTFWALFGINVLSVLASGVTTAMLPLYVRGPLGGGAAAVGIVVGVASLLAMVLRPPLGELADRIGPRPVAIAGALLAIAGELLLLVAGVLALGGVGRMLTGFGGATLNTMITIWVIETALPGARGRALSIFGVSVWIGLGLGPPLGERLLDQFGFTAVWAATAALSTGALCLLLALRTAPRPRGGPRASGGAWLAPLKAVARAGAGGAISWAGQGVVLTFLILHLQARGIGDGGGLLGPGSVFTIFAASVISARLLLRSLPDRVGGARSAAISLLAVAGGLVLIALARSFGLAAVGALVLGGGYAVLYPSLMLVAIASVPPERRGSATGAVLAYMDLGMAAGATAGGLLAAWQGEALAFWVAAAAQLVGVVAIWGARDAPAPPTDASAPAFDASAPPNAEGEPASYASAAEHEAVGGSPRDAPAHLQVDPTQTR
ncbi:MFS transporter [Conexibacter sp. JD483]|uniref:MFS transporter n=1 Tax=unclassified Conexibacter TaxID=2627773 RepID=UPI002726B7BB|nr:MULTISPECIES: MFS transporter [unclassified Conexibacter]MDO8189141.1 MFS transporter [Conexibacter sp. CPCC 205706]MDO8201841.1 MFS transporter [Conexibacter sp. CPCC 205762]MDR9371849.1 MFS transporter [Conexibacter sp. JD483]